jgi:hypothetical protein
MCVLCPARHFVLFVHDASRERRGYRFGAFTVSGSNDPLVKRTFESMERAQYIEMWEDQPANGERVCEKDENGASWQEDCNTCWCDRGRRLCTKVDCPPSSVQLELQRAATLEFERIAREEKKQRKELREMHRAAGRRVCEEDEHGPSWQEDCNTCFCFRGLRWCTRNVCQKSPR